MKLFCFDEHIGDWRVLIGRCDMKDGIITSNLIAPGAVTKEKLAPHSVGMEQLAPGAVEDLAVLQAELQGIIASATAKLEELQGIDIDKPIPDEQIQADWQQTDTTKKDYIKNKPTIPTIPQNLSAFNNNVGFITRLVDNLANYYTKEQIAALLSNFVPQTPSPNVSIDFIADVEENGFFFIDTSGNIGVKIDGNGLNAINLPTFSNY